MRKTGEAEGALEYIKKILVKNPQTPVAHLVAARAEVALEKFDDAEKRLNGMLNRHTPTAIKAGTAKLLGDVYDAKKDYEKAFENYAVGQESSESHNRTRIDEDSVVDDLKRRSAIIDAVDVSEWGPIDDGLADPVFVIGAPRSGISLVEQILCAHSNCVTSNQRPYLSDTILTSPNHSSSQEKYPECLAEWDDESVRKIRQSYWQRVDQFIPDRGNKVLIDKTPMGIADVAFIRRVFPGAPVIHVVRDPRDVCLSCFKEVIDYDLITVLFSQLERTARVYSLMLECGIKASEVLGINLLEVRYEKLVDGFDESRKIVEFIGQTWEPELENFVGVAHEKYVLDLCGETARPLHRNSINRWKHYESKLQPIMPLLADLIERLGY